MKVTSYTRVRRGDRDYPSPVTSVSLITKKVPAVCTKSVPPPLCPRRAVFFSRVLLFRDGGGIFADAQRFIECLCALRAPMGALRIRPDDKAEIPTPKDK